MAARAASRLPPLPSLRDFIHMYQLRATKVLSQNYIMDMNINRKIARASGLKAGGRALEIGPGPGGITRAILEQDPERFDVVELDKQFKEPLEVLREASGNRLHIHFGDILKTDVERIWRDVQTPVSPWWDEPPNLHLIGNLPFNIASPLIIKYLRDMAWRRGAWAFGRVPLTLTFQAEVARRICAPTCTPERSRISIVSQYLTEPKLQFLIPGRCFVPKPEVDVGVVSFVPRERPLINTSFEVVEKVARCVFHYRQKQMVNPLMTLYPRALAKDLAHELLRAIRLDPTRRPFDLEVLDFADIAEYYEGQCRRLPGLFAYNHYGQSHKTLEDLKDHPNALPPVFQVPGADTRSFEGGISLSDARQDA